MLLKEPQSSEQSVRLYRCLFKALASGRDILRRLPLLVSPVNSISDLVLF